MFFFPLGNLLAAAVIVRAHAPVFVADDVRPLVRTSHPSGSRHGRNTSRSIRSAPGTRKCPRKLSVPRHLQQERIHRSTGSLSGPTPLWLATWASQPITPWRVVSKGRDRGESDFIGCCQPQCELTAPSQLSTRLSPRRLCSDQMRPGCASCGNTPDTACARPL